MPRRKYPLPIFAAQGNGQVFMDKFIIAAERLHPMHWIIGIVLFGRLFEAFVVRHIMMNIFQGSEL
jgi:hypothetical protein